MLVKWGMDTCEDCKVVVTANTENQLRTKTRPEDRQVAAPIYHQRLV